MIVIYLTDFLAELIRSLLFLPGVSFIDSFILSFIHLQGERYHEEGQREGKNLQKTHH